MPIDTSKVAVIYCSVHHKNTKKLIDAIAEKYPDILLLNAASVVLKDLQRYELIGVASGIFYGKMHRSVLKFLEDNLPEHKKSFVIYTSGASKDDYGKDAEAIIAKKKCTLLGKYSCRGYDTFGPFALVGGLNKKYPDSSEIDGAVKFFEEMIK